MKLPHRLQLLPLISHEKWGASCGVGRLFQVASHFVWRLWFVMLLLVAMMGGAALAASPTSQPLLDPTDTTNNYGNGSVTGFAIAMGGHTYFFTGDSSGTTHTIKLWKTDGTQASTTLIKDFGSGGQCFSPDVNRQQIVFYDQHQFEWGGLAV